MGCAHPTTASEGPPPRPARGSSLDEGSVQAKRGFHQEYALYYKLGSGCYATVYMADRVADHEADEGVAVKILDLRSGETGGAFDGVVEPAPRQKALEEARILKRVSGHRNVINFVDLFIEAEIAYVVMEVVDISLPEALERMPQMNEGSLMPVFRQMLLGVAAVHSRGVVHRDIKPDNFLCSHAEAPTVKLCDFGLAAMLNNAYTNKLQGIFGTPPFMAPEMLERKAYNCKIDVWSMGVIMYGLFFGEYPYMPTVMNKQSMKAAILAGFPAPRFKGLRDVSVSPKATTLVKRLLIRSPSARPSADEALQGLALRSSGAHAAAPQYPENPRADANLDQLRKNLQALRRLGFFSNVQAGERRARSSNLDARLDSLQDKCRPGSHCRKSDASTDAGSSASERGLSKTTTGSARSS